MHYQAAANTGDLLREIDWGLRTKGAATETFALIPAALEHILQLQDREKDCFVPEVTELS